MDTSRFIESIERERLFALTDKGDFKRTSVSQIKVMQIDYRGWQCPVTNHSLYARHSGTMHSGICGEFVLATDITPWWRIDDITKRLSKSGTCSLKHGACYCGSDINVSKCKTQEDGYKFIENLVAVVHDNGNLVGDYEYLSMDDTVVALGSFYTYFYQRMSITLDYGKKCNLDCAYCSSSIHDNFSPFLEFKKVEKLFELALQINPLGQKVLVITGGEPTLSKELVDVVKLAKEKGFENIHINTNSTASFQKYKELLELGCRLDCTFHEQYVTDNQIEKIRNLLDQYGKFKVLVKILGSNKSPFAQRVKSIFGDKWEHVTSHPIYNRDNYEIIAV